MFRVQYFTLLCVSWEFQEEEELPRINADLAEQIYERDVIIEQLKSQMAELRQNENRRLDQGDQELKRMQVRA